MAYKPYLDFSWNISSYYPLSLQTTHSEAELRKEYTRLRKVAKDSLRRMGKSEFATGETYKKNVNAFPAASTLTSKRELSRALSDVARFMTAKGHSISGLREIRSETIQTFRDKYGYDFLNVSNYDSFMRFLNWYKDYKGTVYDMDHVRNIFVNAEQKQIDLETIKRNFEFYEDELDVKPEAPEWG